MQAESLTTGVVFIKGAGESRLVKTVTSLIAVTLQEHIEPLAHPHKCQKRYSVAGIDGLGIVPFPFDKAALINQMGRWGP